MIGNIALPQIDTGPFRFGSRPKSKQPGDFQSWNRHYQVFIQQHLAQITSGELRRLMLFIPPRHGKSEMVTIRYPVYRLEQDPTLRVIIGAYNQTLAEKFSRKARKIARERIAISDERRAAEDWETIAGGGVRAVGVGAGITGQGGNLIIIDDPVKSRKEANSKVYRDAVYDWYTDDLYTRLEPNAAIILILTRWHEDDLAGRILASDDGPNWTVISLPAEAEQSDPLGRQPGEALNPARYPVPELNKIRTVLKRSYQALYQQRPVEQEGDTFKRSWFPLVKASDLPGAWHGIVRYWDRAATAGDGDYTAGVLMARFNQDYYVLDVVRGQWSTGERDKRIRETAETDRRSWGHVVTWVEQEPGSSGVDAARAFVTLLSGFHVQVDKVTGDKKLRAEPFSSQAEYGFVRVLRAPWYEDWIDELTSFPAGAHDDQVDATSGAFGKLAIKNTVETGYNPFEDLR